MKKKITALFLAVTMILSLTACDSNHASLDSQGSDLLTDSTTQGEALSDSENEALSKTKEGLKIALNGENEVTITLNDEAVGKLAQNAESNLRILLQEEGASEFECESEIYISNNSWNLLRFTNKDTDECEIIVDGSSEGVIYDTTCTLTISRVGICSYFDTIEQYRILFTDANNENFQTTLASGFISDVLCVNTKEQQHILQAMFPDEETIKFKIYGEEAKTSFYNYEQMRINIYESEKQINADNPCPSVEFIVEAASENTGEGRIYAIAYSQGEGGTGHVIEENSNNSEGRTLGTDYGVVMKYRNESIGEYVKPEYLYELYLGNDKVETGKISDIIVTEEYTNIPAIPDTFPTNDMDGEYFTPATDDYVITMVTYPEVPFFDFEFGRDQGGNPIYAPKSNHMSAMKVVKMTSYDEFGIVDERSKTIYDNDADAMSAFCNRQTWLDASSLQLNETMEDPAIIKLFDEYNEDYFSSRIQAGEYLGRFENVMYFIGNGTFGNSSLSSELIPLENPTYESDGLATMDYPYEYDFADLSRGHSFIMDDTGTLVQYASKNIADTIDYKAESEKYNTVPDSWQEHPYASYLPELPSGVTVDFIEGLTINETNLALYTDANGCTREQAENYMEAFQNMEYENEIVEQRYEVDDDYEYMLVRFLEGNIRILVSWRVEEQRLYIYADKN